MSASLPDLGWLFWSGAAVVVAALLWNVVDLRRRSRASKAGIVRLQALGKEAALKALADHEDRLRGIDQRPTGLDDGR